MESRAQRHLDGCRVNTDRMAKDVLALVATVRTLQQQLHEADAPSEPVAINAHGSFQDALDEVLDGALGKAKP
jgi:hypothetical protein